MTLRKFTRWYPIFVAIPIFILAGINLYIDNTDLESAINIIMISLLGTMFLSIAILKSTDTDYKDDTDY